MDFGAVVEMRSRFLAALFEYCRPEVEAPVGTGVAVLRLPTVDDGTLPLLTLAALGDRLRTVGVVCTTGTVLRLTCGEVVILPFCPFLVASVLDCCCPGLTVDAGAVGVEGFSSCVSDLIRSDLTSPEDVSLGWTTAGGFLCCCGSDLGNALIATVAIAAIAAIPVPIKRPRKNDCLAGGRSISSKDSSLNSATADCSY